ncbi:hypothetical protein CAPTEDRAFT_204236, partial [Capitella teleta]
MRTPRRKSKTNGQEVTQKARTDKLSLGRFKTKRTGHPLKERRGRTRQRQGVDREWERVFSVLGKSFGSKVEAKQLRQDRSKYVPLNEHQVSVGDGITINCAEPVTLSHLRDNAFKVVSVKGKVVGYVPLFGKQPSKPRYINIDRVRPVPQNVSWDEINPRPRRNRTNTDVRTWTRPLELPNLHLSTGQNRVERDDGQRSPAPLPLIVQEVVSPEDLEELPRLADSSGDDESMIQKSIRPLRRSERLKRRWADEDQKSKTNGQEVTQKARTDKLSLGRFKTKRTGHPLKERRGRTRQRQGVDREWERVFSVLGKSFGSKRTYLCVHTKGHIDVNEQTNTYMMEEVHKELITDNLVPLTRDLDPGQIYTELIAGRVLTFEDKEKISKIDTRKAQSMELISVLLRKGPNAFG